MHVYVIVKICFAINDKFHPKKLQVPENRLLKIVILCFLQGTSPVRQKVLLHCEHVTMDVLSSEYLAAQNCVILRSPLGYKLL